MEDSAGIVAAAASHQPERLTASEDSDTTRVYDLSKRETSILRSDIIRTSRLPVPKAFAPSATTPPSSPVDDDIVEANYHQQSHQLEEHIAFQQLSDIKKAIESRSTSSSPIRFSSPLAVASQKWFGDDDSNNTKSTVNSFSVPPRAKRLTSFPFCKMEDDNNVVVISTALANGNVSDDIEPAVRDIVQLVDNNEVETESVDEDEEEINVKNEAAVVTVVSAVIEKECILVTDDGDEVSVKKQEQFVSKMDKLQIHLFKYHFVKQTQLFASQIHLFPNHIHLIFIG